MFFLNLNKVNNREAIIFDIGANAGNFSHKYQDKCKIVSVEANPILAEALKKRFSEKSNIFVENCAISNKKGTINFFICAQDQMSSCNRNWLETLRYKKHGIQKTIEVPAITLDDLIEKYGSPHHIKIDVEGYELEVISGLSKKVGSIQFEYIREEFETLTVPIFFKLKNLGYDKFKHRPAACSAGEGDFDAFDSVLSLEEIIKIENLPNVPGGMILAS